MSNSVAAIINSHILPHDEQFVSGTVIFLCQLVTPHDQQYVSDTAFFLCQVVSSHTKGCGWQKLHFSFPSSLIHLFTWPTGSQWQYMFSIPGSLTRNYRMWVMMCVFNQVVSYTFSHNQGVSDTGYFLCQEISSHLIPWPTGSEWHWIFYLPCSLITFLPMTNRQWVTLDFSLMGIHQIYSDCQQEVSDTGSFC